MLGKSFESTSDLVADRLTSRVTEIPVLIGKKNERGRTTRSAELRDLVNDSLSAHGAVLLRDVGLKNAQDFRDILTEIDWKFLDYVEGGSSRTLVLDGIFTSTEYSKEHYICLHNELSYTACPPDKLAFFCEIAPGTGGQTPILDSGKVLNELPSSLVKEFLEKSVMYVRNIPNKDGLIGKSWEKTFSTSSKQKVEEILNERGVDFRWTETGLRTQQVRPAVTVHRHTQQKIWFNQCDLWHHSSMGEKGQQMIQIFGIDSAPTHSKFGDGTEIPADTIEKIKKVCFESSLVFDWQPGDLLILDNLRFAHGRNPFTGSRRVLVSMS